MWLRFESFGASGTSTGTPYLASFLTEDSAGLEIFIQQNFFQLKTTVSRNRTESVSLRLPLNTKRWYFVTVTHAYRFLTKSEVSVFVNGKLTDTSSLVYPKSDNITQCFIGTNTSPDSSQNLRKPQQALQAQIGQVLMLQGAAEASDVSAFFDLGPNFIAQGDNCVEVHLSKKTLKPLFSYHPKASNGLLCYEVVSNVQTRCASLLPGTSVVHALPLHKTFYRAGGLKLLLPLFRQLGLPQASSTSSNSNMSASSIQPLAASKLKESPIQQNLVNLLTFAAVLVERDRSLLNDMACCGFFSLFSFSINKLAPSSWSTVAINALDKLGTAVMPSHALRKQYFLHIVSNFDLWIVTPAHIQAYIANLFMRISAESPNMAREIMGVQTVIDILRLYYWFTPEEGISRNVGTLTAIEQNPAIVHEVRFILLKAINNFTQMELTAEEIKCFLLFLEDCRDGEQCVDILQFLLNLSGQPGQTLLQCLLKVDGIRILLQQLRRPNAPMAQLWALKLLCQALKLAEDASFGVEESVRDSYLSILKMTLQSQKLTRQVYIILMEFLLDTPSMAVQYNITISKDSTIKVKRVLPVIFELLVHAESVEIQNYALTDFVSLVQLPENCSIFFSFPLWQTWLFALLGTKTTCDFLLPGVIQILTTLLLHAFKAKNGWVVIQQTYSLLDYFNETAFLKTPLFSSSLNHTLLDKMSQDHFLMMQFQATSGDIYLNISWWLCFVGIQLFPPQPGVTVESLDTTHFVNNMPWNNTTGRPWPSASTSQALLNFIMALQQPKEEVVIAPVPSPSLTPPPNSTSPGSASPAPLPPTAESEKDPELVLLAATIEAMTLRLIIGSLWENQVLDAAMGVNLQFLKREVDRILQLDNQKGKLMYILAFLFRAMQSSQGTAASTMRSLFLEIWGRSNLKSQLAVALDGDAILQVFLGHFLQTPVPVIRPLDAELHTFVLYENKLFLIIQGKLNDCKNDLMSKLATRVSDEHVLQAKMEDELIQMIHSHAEEEGNRMRSLQEAHKRSVATKRFCWRDFMRNLWPENFIHWMHDNNENSQRMRKKLKPNVKFDPHKDKVPVTRLDNVSETGNLRVSHLPEAVTTLEFTEVEGYTEPPPADSKPVESTASVFFRNACELIEPMTATPGYFECTAKTFHFVAAGEVEGTVNHVSVNAHIVELSWAISKLKVMYTRRYLLRDSGLELFFEDRSNIFLNFPSQSDRNSVYKNITRNTSPWSVRGTIQNLVLTPPPPSQILKKQGFTELWVSRKITNFDYLMALNTVAGRTFNDLTQYPVFPWILADYTSATLDLNNPATFRNLSVPMGALDPKKRSEAVLRYETFNDPKIPKFHYGTHYSSLGAVLHYLIRLEPYATNFLEFQGGKFDHPNRMFLGIGQSWSGASHDNSSVKELIPEFFYLPEFLVNHNRFNFGLPFNDPSPTDENGQVSAGVGDVMLPPWAKGSPELFIQLHREALESDYVSEHLHEWIDLIFGYKQRGEAAVEACNVYFYLTYEGSVNLESITDKVTKESVISQIYNFGQTPSQLFTTPHPKRSSKIDALDKALSTVADSMGNMPYSFLVNISGFTTPLASIVGLPNQKFVTLAFDGTLGISTFNTAPDGKGSPFTIVIDTTLSTPRQKKSIDILYAPHIIMRDTMAVTPDVKTIFTCGDWDARFHIRGPNGKANRSVSHGSDVISCLALDGNFLVLGSRDSTLSVYDITHVGTKKNKEIDPFKDPIRMLYGHNGPVACLCVKEDYDLVVSASHSTAPQCLVHTLRCGNLLHTFPINRPIDQLICTSQGYIVAYQNSISTVSVFSINAQPLCESKVDPLTTLVNTPDGKYLAAANTAGGINVYSVFGLQLVHKYNTDAVVSALSFVGEGSFLIAGLTTGVLVVFVVLPNNFEPPKN
ncbi:beach protein [Pelomyxa schiedti]|nr:beach protein [Pelomyxa schiedti]